MGTYHVHNGPCAYLRTSGFGPQTRLLSRKGLSPGTGMESGQALEQEWNQDRVWNMNGTLWSQVDPEQLLHNIEPL